jgi:hypothetical protein
MTGCVFWKNSVISFTTRNLCSSGHGNRISGVDGYDGIELMISESGASSFATISTRRAAA